MSIHFKHAIIILTLKWEWEHSSLSLIYIWNYSSAHNTPLPLIPCQSCLSISCWLPSSGGHVSPSVIIPLLFEASPFCPSLSATANLRWERTAYSTSGLELIFYFFLTVLDSSLSHRPQWHCAILILFLQENNTPFCSSHYWPDSKWC